MGRNTKAPAAEVDKLRTSYRYRVRELRALWQLHDRIERQILMLERTFTDKQLRRLGAAGGG